MRVVLVCALTTTIIAAQTPARPTPPRDRPARTRPTDNLEPEPGRQGVIRGRIVADEPDGKTPIAKARVQVSSEAATEWMFTDSSGLFEFSELPAGRYTVFAEKSGYAAGPVEIPVVVELAVGAREEMEIRLPKGAVIAGHVVDDLGEPLVGARVMVYAIRIEGTLQRLVASPQVPSDTDDLGSFRVGGLPAGRYLLGIFARNREPPASSDLTSPPTLPRIGSGRTFYPSTATPGDATPIVLRPGEERLDVEVAFTPYRPAALTVAVASAQDPALKGAASPADALRLGVDPAVFRSPQGVRVVLANRDSPDILTENRNYAISSLGPNPASTTVSIDPGSWDVIARKGPDGALARLTLAPGETQSIVLEIRPASRFSGRIAFEGSTRRPDASSVQVDVIGAGPDRNVSPLFLLPGGRVAVKPDGSFSLAGVLGMVEFIVTAPAGWVVSRFTAGDRDLLGAPLMFEGGEIVADARIVLSDAVAEISGSVADSDASPAAVCRIAVFPAGTDAEFDRYRMRLVQADRMSRFVVRDLPSGSYFVAAAQDIRAGSWTDPESLARLRAGAATVTLAEHEKKAVALQCRGSQ